MVHRLGTRVAHACRATDDRIRLSYGSPQGTFLQAELQPTLEFSEQRLTMEGLTTEASLELLREMERDSFGDEGCGILWTGAPESVERKTGQETVYWGDTCNCQGRIVHRGTEIQALIFRSAC